MLQRHLAPLRTYSLSIFLCLLASPIVNAQEIFQFVGDSGTQTWEIASNWTGGSGLHSSYPGESPQAGTLDSADLTGGWTEDLTLVLATDVQLDKLSLGSTSFMLLNNVIATDAGAQLSVREIESTGSLISLNRIDGDLSLGGNLDITGTNPLTLAGKVVLHEPSPGEIQEVINHTNQRLLVQGQVELSDTAGQPGYLEFQNAGISVTHVTGEISDGAAAGGRVTYAKGEFIIFTDQNYTGITQLGENDPNVGSTHIIHTDQPFGLGRVVFGGGNAHKVIQAALGQGTRTLANDIQIAREAVFAGSEDIVLNGTVYQSNGRRLINDIVDSKSLTINGDIFASNTTDVRDWRFDGTGNTIVNGTIDDSLGHPELTGGSVTKDGPGRVIFTNPGVAAYTGATHVTAGILQLGNGGTAVNLNDDQLTGDATVEINHAESMTFGPNLAGSVTVRHVGPGTTTLDRASTGDGEISIEAGTLLVNAGDGITSGTGSGDVQVAGGTLGGVGHVGGHVAAHADGTIAPGTSIGSISLRSLDLQLDSQLQIELGDLASSEYDQLSVLTDVTLAGSLDVMALESFSFASSPSLEILNVGGSLVGQFAGLDEGSLVGNFGGADLFITYQAGDGNDVHLFATSASGDFNADGQVDGQDFLTWQRDPQVGALSDWQVSYGSPTASALATVPEPATLTLSLALAVALPVARTRCR